MKSSKNDIPEIYNSLFQKQLLHKKIVSQSTLQEER